MRINRTMFLEAKAHHTYCCNIAVHTPGTIQTRHLDLLVDRSTSAEGKIGEYCRQKTHAIDQEICARATAQRAIRALIGGLQFTDHGLIHTSTLVVLDSLHQLIGDSPLSSAPCLRGCPQ